MEKDQNQARTESEVRFAFGANWKDYATSVSATQIDDAVRRLDNLVAATDLRGATFVDIGCGSGLHSLAALKQGVSRLVALDYDSLSVETTRSLLAEFWNQIDQRT